MQSIQKIPDTREVRERIEDLPSYPHRYALQFQLLTGARSSEICGRYAISGADHKIYEYSEKENHPALVFQVKTAKREGRLRLNAIPLEPKYEPWAQDLADYFEKKTKQKKSF